MKKLYLALAAIGTVLPWFYFASWFNEFGWSWASFDAMSDDWVRTSAGRGLFYDVMVAWVALLIAIVVDAVRARDWKSLLAIPAATIIGVSAGLPLYLYFREARKG